MIITNVTHEWSEVFMCHSIRNFKKFMDDAGISYSQVPILMRLAPQESFSITEIGEQMEVTNHAISQF